MTATWLQKKFQYITFNVSRASSSKLNPLHYLGAIAIFLLVADFISGVYLYVFYKIDPRYTYTSVEAISATFVGNIMRGLHRYTSAGLVMVTLMHAAHILVTDRFRRYRWLAWITGGFSLVMFIIIGVSGYVLVWDTKAQLIGILAGKFLSFLPIFGDAIMSTFFGTDMKNLGGFFRMILYFHVAVTLAILFFLWIHVMRNARPRIVPPKYIWVSLLVYMILLSIVFPAVSDPVASLSRIPFEIHIDWFYFTLFPLLKVVPLAWTWLLMIVGFIVLFAFPWIFGGKKNPVVSIDAKKCTGCERCYMDCPYEAIVMNIKDKKKMAIVDEDMCSGCGICLGSCSFKAITFSEYLWQRVMDEIRAKFAKSPGASDAPDVVVMRCPFAAQPAADKGVITYTVPCIGSVHPNHARDILKSGASGLMLVSCEQEDCHYREGVRWLRERYERRRKPYLTSDVDLSRIRVLEAAHVKNISGDIDAFRGDLKAVQAAGLNGGGNVGTGDGTGAQKKAGKLTFVGFNKLNHALMAVLLIVPTFLLYPLTDYKMAFYPPDKSVVIITFKYRSSPSIASARSPLKADLVINGKQVYSKIFNPRGIRHDSSVFIYDEILLDPGQTVVDLHIEETLFPEKQQDIVVSEFLKPEDGIIISFDEETHKLVHLQ
jgi:quinol-cytochrome oxidoreductase complex cytochrome b subunit/coenzyme F420-reducing hydrogenase delta subunit